VFAALLVGGWWFDWKSQLEELEAKRQQEEKLKTSISTRKSRL
jgi:Tfp pilus assembly protein PilO